MRKLSLSLTLSIGVALIGCAPLSPLASTPETLPTQTRPVAGMGDLVMQLRMGGAWTLQDVAAPNVRDDIKRLEIIPSLKDGEAYLPLSTSGGTTTEGAVDQLKLVYEGQFSAGDRYYTLKNLPYDRTYRIQVRAYDALGKLISVEAQSYKDVAFSSTSWDSSVSVPLQLTNVPYSASTSAQVTFVGQTGSTQDVLFSLVKVDSQDVETVIPGATMSVALGDLPRKINLGNLHPETRYRFKAQPRRADNTVLTTGLLEWTTTSDSQPVAPKSLALRLDPNDVTTYAGGGPEGILTGQRLAVSFKTPYDVAQDKDGNLYVSDYMDHRIRKIDTNGNVTTWVGSGNAGIVDGRGEAASITSPLGMVFDKAGNMFVISYADSISYSGGLKHGHNIRKITPQGDVTVFVGSPTGVSGHADGTGHAARFNHPIGLTIDTDDNLYVADCYNHRIRKITPQGEVTTIAGSEQGFADGNGANAKFYNPFGICLDQENNLYVTDANNKRIRKIAPNGDVTTIAGTEGAQSPVDGPVSSARLRMPTYLTITSFGTLYFSDGNAIRKISPEGMVVTVAGSVSTTGMVNAIGTEARFYTPYGIKAMPDDTLFVADFGNRVVRRVAYP